MPAHRSSFRPRLESESLNSAHIQAVTAPGGVGKTKLARHYADRYWRLYRRIFFVDRDGFVPNHGKRYDAIKLYRRPQRETAEEARENDKGFLSFAAEKSEGSRQGWGRESEETVQ